MTDQSSTPKSASAAPQDTLQQRFSQLLGGRARRWVDQGGALLAKLSDGDAPQTAPNLEQDHYPDPRALFRNQLPVLTKQLFGARVGSASQLMSKFIPLDAIEQWSDHLFEQAARFATHLSPMSELLELAEVADEAALHRLSPEQASLVVDRIMNRNRLLVAAEGALTGWTGILGAVVDLPAVLIIGLRSIYQIGQCYGVDLSTPVGQQTVYRVLAAADLSLISEKQALMLSLTTLQQLIAQGNVAALQGMVGSATNAAYFQKLTQDLSQALNIHIRPQVLSRVVPLAASATSAVYNVRLVTAIGHMAQLAFVQLTTTPTLLTQDATVPVAAAAVDDMVIDITAVPSAVITDEPLDATGSAPVRRRTSRRVTRTEDESAVTEDSTAVPRKRTSRSKKVQVDDVEPENKTQH
ncbi:MAG: hypothetical protein RLY58_1557 [Pseudomonadota bacterium]|jgi:hypothetical protein